MLRQTIAMDCSKEQLNTFDEFFSKIENLEILYITAQKVGNRVIYINSHTLKEIACHS